MQKFEAYVHLKINMSVIADNKDMAEFLLETEALRPFEEEGIEAECEEIVIL